MLSFSEFCNEGLLDFLKKKPESPKMQELTPEHRAMIHKHFVNSNVNLKFSSGGKHVITHNAHAKHGSLSVAFRNEGGALKASVAHYASSRHANDLHAIPVTHTDHDISSDADMQYIKSLSH